MINETQPIPVQFGPLVDTRVEITNEKVIRLSLHQIELLRQSLSLHMLVSGPCEEVLNLLNLFTAAQEVQITDWIARRRP